MRDTLLLEPVHRLEQILPETLQQLELQAAFFPQTLRKRFLTGAIHKKANATPKLYHLVELNDELVT